MPVSPWFFVGLFLAPVVIAWVLYTIATRRPNRIKLVSISVVYVLLNVFVLSALAVGYLLSIDRADQIPWTFGLVVIGRLVELVGMRLAHGFSELWRQTAQRTELE